MATTKSIKSLTVGEMKDKFLIQRDILSNYDLKRLEGLRGDGELNHGIRECKTGGWEAKPWGLDGLVLNMNYDEDSKIGWYDMQYRFRLYGDIVVRLDKEEQKLFSNGTLYSEVIKADTADGFLKIMQESIDSSLIMISYTTNSYDIIFRNVSYSSSACMDENFLAFVVSVNDYNGNGPKTMIIYPLHTDMFDKEDGIPCKIISLEGKYYGNLLAD